MANRTRNESLIIRMTKEEKEIFLKKMKATKSKSYIELLMKCIRTHSTVKIDTSPILDMVYEINKIGVNLNQLTKAVNTAKDLNDNNAEKLREEIAKTKEKIGSILDMLNKTMLLFNKAEKGDFDGLFEDKTHKE